MGQGRANRGLVTQSLIRNASAATNASTGLDLAALTDLCSLCEALVLLDDVQSLEAADSHQSPLTERLQAEGLYGTLRPTLSAVDLRRLFLRLPAELGSRTLMPDGQDPPTRLTGSPLDGSGEPAKSLDDLVGQIDRLVGYHSSGTVASERAYRGNGYLVVAAAHGLDYFPDFERGIFTAGTLAKVYHSLPMKLYGKVAEALDEPLNGSDLMSEWARISTIPIPPVSALVLERARTPSELPEAMLRVRDDFVHYRRYFAAFKADLENADTLKERAKLRKRYQTLLDEASGPHAEMVSLASMLNLTQSAVNAAASPMAATSYGALLLTQPIDWIQQWWRRRPLAILFRLDSKLPRLSAYQRLVSKLWGEPAAAQILDEMVRRAAWHRTLLDDGSSTRTYPGD